MEFMMSLFVPLALAAILMCVLTIAFIQVKSYQMVLKDREFDELSEEAMNEIVKDVHLHSEETQPFLPAHASPYLKAAWEDVKNLQLPPEELFSLIQAMLYRDHLLADTRKVNDAEDLAYHILHIEKAEVCSKMDWSGFKDFDFSHFLILKEVEEGHVLLKAFFTNHSDSIKSITQELYLCPTEGGQSGALENELRSLFTSFKIDLGIDLIEGNFLLEQLGDKELQFVIEAIEEIEGSFLPPITAPEGMDLEFLKTNSVAINSTVFMKVPPPIDDNKVLKQSK